jgi:hypothetical protein
MKLTDKVTIPPNVLARGVGAETVILDLESGTYFGLDPVGARIWQLLSEGQSLADICAAIQSEYDVGAADAEKDLVTLVDELVAQGLVRSA